MSKLSVITVNYNNKSGLVRTIESVLAQTYPDIESIVVDGGSTDGSAEYLRSPEAARVRAVSEKDRGIYHAMQKGLSMVQGDAVLFLNSGDWFFDNAAVSRVVDGIDIGKVIVLGRTASVFGDHMYIRPRLGRLGLLIDEPAHQAVIVPARVARAVQFDEGRFISADSDWVSKCLTQADYVLTPAVLSYFELGGVSNSAKLADLKKWVLEATGGLRWKRFFKACVKFGLRSLFGPKWLYRVLLSHKYEVHDLRRDPATGQLAR